MAKTRTLPDKYYDKDYETNGIHRVPLWRIAGFALNNTATNLYLMFMNYVSFYLLGFVGVGMVMASSFTMAMRIWDGVTDPFIGYMVDKTNGKFGKNRPFMVIGNIILAASSFIMFHFTHKLPEGPARFIFFVVFCCIYYLGYTCQCVVTKSAQSCMTNDPKQRPMFASFDGVFNTILFTVLAIVVANIANKYADVGNYTSTQFFHEFWMMTAIMSAIFTVIAVISIAPKDRPEFFGTGKPIKVGLKDYWDTLKNNRAIQMLVLSASTDKLGSTAKTSAVSVAMFACIAGSIPEFQREIPIQMLEQRYANENAIWDAAACGNTEAALKACQQMARFTYGGRFFGSLYQTKIMLTVMNTLLRKAIERSNIHPYYIDEISSRYALMIENMVDEESWPLVQTMVKEYCAYVRRYSLQQYSPLVQKVINTINLNLSDQLSPKSLAAMYYISPSYLSSLFKQDTGTTLTHFINTQRIQRAANLLSTTEQNISVVAEQVGILDVNYFTKMFKKSMGSTPTQYRRQSRAR